MALLSTAQEQTAIDEAILTRLEQALEAERAALIQRDWNALREATIAKEALAATLTEMSKPLPAPLSERMHSLRRTADHNGRLAHRLSGQVAQLVSSTRGSRYGRHARLYAVQHTALHVVG